MRRNVISYGAVDDGVTDCTDAIKCAIADMNNGDTLYFPVECDGIYKVTDTIIIPNKNLFFKGDGAWSANIVMHAPGALFYYARGAADPFISLNFFGLTITREGWDKRVGSYGICSVGYDDARANNYLRVTECVFYGWEAGIKAKWTGQSRVDRCFFQGNRYSTYLERGASFWSYRDCMSFDETFIKAYDPIADAYSNAMFIDSCSNVTGSGACIDATGWQSIYVDKCGWDLGSGGAAALIFTKCMDVSVAKSYISGNGVAQRNGVNIIDSPRVSLLHNRIVNCYRGVVAENSYPAASAIVIDGNEFDGNMRNDIFFKLNISASKIVNNHFAKQMARVGNDFEVYAYTAGTESNVFAYNTFHGSAYSAGPIPNSVVGFNIFNSPAG